MDVSDVSHHLTDLVLKLVLLGKVSEASSEVRVIDLLESLSGSLLVSTRE